MLAELRATRGAIEHLDRTLAAQGETPESELLVIPLSSASIPNAWYATSDQLRIVGLDFYTDTAARYALTIENDQALWFRAAINTRVPVIDAGRRLVVPRGVRVGFTTSGSTNFTTAGVWDAIIWAYAGTARGRESTG